MCFNITGKQACNKTAGWKGMRLFDGLLQSYWMSHKGIIGDWNIPGSIVRARGYCIKRVYEAGSGIHVFLRAGDAEDFCNGSNHLVAVKVILDPDDLINIGIDWGMPVANYKKVKVAEVQPWIDWS